MTYQAADYIAVSGGTHSEGLSTLTLDTVAVYLLTEYRIMLHAVCSLLGFRIGSVNNITIKI